MIVDRQFYKRPPRQPVGELDGVHAVTYRLASHRGLEVQIGLKRAADCRELVLRMTEAEAREFAEQIIKACDGHNGTIVLPAGF